jgi:hypothetical protein
LSIKNAKAGLRKTVSDSKGIFFTNTAQKRYGRRQPCHSAFSCLGVKIFPFELLRSFDPWIFPCGKESLCGNTLCISRSDSEATGEKTGAKPNNVL